MRTPSRRTFSERVFKIVRAIPSGKTFTYGEVARRAGNPSAARAVGAVLKTNFDSKIPCHRVIRADGSLGGYNRGEKRKRALLRTEGGVI